MSLLARTRLLLLSGALCTALVAPPPVFADQLGDAGAAYEGGDFAEALRLWRPPAEEGNAIAQFWIGHMYRTGRGVEKDMEEAIKWFRRAAAQQEPMAEYILGFLYYAGDGVPKDIDYAVEWLRLAAEHGDIEALNYVGKLHASGEWQPHDDAVVRDWYLKVIKSYRARAGALGPDSLYIMGLMHERDGSISVEPSDAESWFKKAFNRYLPAARAGDRHAQCMLHYMYRLGQGVSRSREESEHWLGLARRQEPRFPCLQESFLVE